MQPNYSLFIDVCVQGLREEYDVWLRHVRYVPFVPRSGDRIRLIDETAENELTLELSDVYYDTETHAFIADIQDESIAHAFRINEDTPADDIVAAYTPFGFIRLNFPTGTGKA